jgi:prolyl-tRNA synthetase
MFLSKIFLPTLREAPVDADTVSAKLMLRSGMIRKVSSGVYEWLPIGLKVLKKVEQIIREEMNKIDGQEVWLSHLLPRGLWDETGRWNIYGKELFRLKDRKESEFCLGPTHEEAITDLVRREVRSYRQLPLMLYQFGTKFRDEIRPRFGVMRAKEFYMKDAYSFHPDDKSLEDYYVRVVEAYKKICERCGFKYRIVEATTGAIGGSMSHEFMVIAETGEEEIVWCDCGYGSNVEKAACESGKCAVQVEKPKALEEVHTPGLRKVEEVEKFLNKEASSFIKTLIYVADDKPVVALVRGDHEVNEYKLQALLECTDLRLADEETVQRVSGAPLGFAGPVGLKSGIRVIADNAIKDLVNGISGANKKDYHLANINADRDFKPELFADIRKVNREDSCPECKKNLNFNRGIEIGHTFNLGVKYSKAMNAVFLDAEGKETTIIMGCYGIGVSRIVAATVEQSNDASGIIWPASIAPFKVSIIPVNFDDEATKKAALEIYGTLTQKGIEVLLDDRNERAGVKFNDADLIGIPYRITISQRSLKENKVEIKGRSEQKDKARLVTTAEAIDWACGAN